MYLVTSSEPTVLLWLPSAPYQKTHVCAYTSTPVHTQLSAMGSAGGREETGQQKAFENALSSVLMLFLTFFSLKTQVHQIRIIIILGSENTLYIGTSWEIRIATISYIHLWGSPLFSSPASLCPKETVRILNWSFLSLAPSFLLSIM